MPMSACGHEPSKLRPNWRKSELQSDQPENRNTLKQQNIDSETGQLPQEDTARGFAVAKGQYVLVEDQEIDAVRNVTNLAALRAMFTKNRMKYIGAGGAPANGAFRFWAAFREPLSGLTTKWRKRPWMKTA